VAAAVVLILFLQARDEAPVEEPASAEPAPPSEPEAPSAPMAVEPAVPEPEAPEEEPALAEPAQPTPDEEPTEETEAEAPSPPPPPPAVAEQKPEPAPTTAPKLAARQPREPREPKAEPATPTPKPGPASAPEPPTAGEPVVATPDAESPMQIALACLARGDNPCVVRALEGNTRSHRELELLIETHRAMGNGTTAEQLMRTYVERYPGERRATTYRRLLDRKAAEGAPAGDESAAPAPP
jgi:outer membrane biosynthesis protein TonB